ncbi:MAG: SPFH domain-containing protein, partial [Planctomycetota bacterium]
MITENVVTGRRGGIALAILLPIFIFSLICFIVAGAEDDAAWGLTGLLLFLGSLLGMFGLIVVQPNEAKVLVLFGTYKGSVKMPGWYWVNPFLWKKRISMRV